MNIGTVLKDLRVGKNLTQITVQNRTGISQTFLSQLENGDKLPSRKMLKRLSDLYGVPPIIVLWKGANESDVQKSKLSAFRKLKPLVDRLIDEHFK